MFKVAVIVFAVMFTACHLFATIDTPLQMQLGDPSGAIVDTNNHNHYLIQRPVEALDYSDNLGEPVWASWDLTANDIGGSGRNSTFYTDTNLPPNFYRVSTADYNGVGAINFNRGHLCPSADRTDTTNDNKLVFFMSNIIPQSALNNQGVWGNFEDYCRDQLANNELLIICGGSGFGTNTIPSGKAYIPSNVWKIVVFVPLGSGTALSRITATNRVIAISIPNVTNGLSSDWHQYVTSPQKIEQDTGFTFFTALPTNIASTFRTEVDGTPYFSGNIYSNNQFQFTVNGWTGTNYVVQSTTNLVTPNWISLKTNAAPFQFTDTNSLPQRFYRAKIWP
ncbi:MAG TPA: DNA/RNA non-specific endonuclease [Verrucomicrobiae bacterium]|nr:DNA/RNA non-specific endonuclease [Verrucomicrobiae bacterium]